MATDKGLVLVAHPDSDVLAESFSVLSSLGYSVATRASVAETLKWVQARKPDFVLCSAGMTSFQGTPLARCIRQASPGSRIFLLVDGDGAPVQDAEGVLHSHLAGKELDEILGASSRRRAAPCPPRIPAQ